MERKEGVDSVRKDLKFYIKKLVVFGKHERSLRDLLLVYTFFSIALLVVISGVINLLIELSDEIYYVNIGISIFFISSYVLSNILKNLQALRIAFIIVGIMIAVIMWFLTQGSSGPTVLLFAAFVTLLVFISVGKEFTIAILAVLLTSSCLYFIEYTHPEILMHYPSDKEKILDSFSLAVLLFAFEVPLLIYARNVLFKERTEALETAECKSNMLADMSHEIRTPMNAIIGFSELLSDPDIEKEEHDNYLKIIGQNSRTLLNLLNNIISASKLSSGTTQVYCSACNVNSLLANLHATLNVLSVNRDVELKVSYSNDKDVELVSDENLLFQILVNIGFNALKFTKKGHISLCAKLEQEHIVFSISDTGSGIPLHKQSTIFKRYEQAENNSLTPSNGAGLGLSICKSFTELLRGEIWFESEPDVGTQFFVKLPLN